MILDSQLVFADAAQFNVATATPESAPDWYDTAPLFTGNSGVDLGTGCPVYGYIRVDTAFDSASDGASAEIRFVSAAASPTGSPPTWTTPTVHWTSGVLPELTLAEDYEIRFVLPPLNVTTWLRYVGFQVVASGENITAGNLTMVLGLGVDGEIPAFANGLNFA